VTVADFIALKDESWAQVRNRAVTARVKVIRRTALDNYLALWEVTDPDGDGKLVMELAANPWRNHALIKEYEAIAPGEIITVIGVARSPGLTPRIDDARILPKQTKRDD
jgi:hypothetical protein